MTKLGCSTLTISCVCITADNSLNNTIGYEVEFMLAQCENELAKTKAL